MARAGAVAALLLAVAAGLLPVESGGSVIVVLTAVATVSLFIAAACVLAGMRRDVPSEQMPARRAAMTVATLAALAALPMIWIANQRLIDHLRETDPPRMKRPPEAETQIEPVHRRSHGEHREKGVGS